MNQYTILQTLLFSFVGIFAYFLSYLYLTKLRKVKIDMNFVKVVLSFVFLGVFLRLLFQSYSSIFLGINPYPSLTTYPGLFFVLSFLFLVCLEISLFLEKRNKQPYHKYLFYLSLPLFVAFCYMLYFFTYIIYFVICIISIAILYFFTKTITKKIINTNINKLTILSQITDAFTSVFGLFVFKNIFYEQHLFSSLVISINPFLFVFLKVGITLTLLYFLDKNIKDKQLNIYLKLLIIILGFSTGVRNLFTIGLLV